MVSWPVVGVSHPLVGSWPVQVTTWPQPFCQRPRRLHLSSGPYDNRVLLGATPHVHLPCSLTLEWNNLGPWEDAFAAFCGALAGNGALRQLDLRNNQISHKGAEELALALTRNAHLQQLGEASLHWPSPLGLQSGALSPAPLAFLLLLALLPLLSSSRSKGVGRCCREGSVSGAPALLGITGSTLPQRNHPGLGQPCAGTFHLVTTGFLPDLRWNSVGLLGGRALVNCLPRNRTLWRLELAGNNVPGDILRAVGMGTRGR